MILRTRLLRRAVVSTLTLGLIAAGYAGIAGAATVQSSPKLPSATLNGSGSTLTAAFLQQVIAEFKTVQPNVTVNYGAGGSGKGRQDFADSVVAVRRLRRPVRGGAGPADASRSTTSRRSSRR